MSLNRAASRALPLALRHSLRSRPPAKIPAIAILIPTRALNTDSSTGRHASGPPPGFDLNKAKKPIPESKGAAQKDVPKDEKSTAQRLKEQVAIPLDVATASPKGDAVEAQSLTELAAAKAAQSKSVDKKKDEAKKLTVWQKVKKEAAHYWDGTKLLAAEVKISSRLALKMAAGYELTRRESRQVRIESDHS